MYMIYVNLTILDYSFYVRGPFMHLSILFLIVLIDSWLM